LQNWLEKDIIHLSLIRFLALRQSFFLNWVYGMVFLALIASVILFWDPVLWSAWVWWRNHVGILIELVVLNVESGLCTGLKTHFWLLDWFPLSYLLAALVSFTSWSSALVSDLVRNSLKTIFFVHHSLFSLDRQSFFIDSDPHWWFWARID
jgi:hypothetical protein